MSAQAVIGDLGVGFGCVAFGLARPVADTPSAASLWESLVAASERPDRGAGHRAVALSQGGAQLAVRRHPPRILGFEVPAEWQFALVHAPSLHRTPPTVRNAIPRTVHTMKHARQAALTAALAVALERGDANLLRDTDEDAIVLPAAGPALPGLFPTVAAARAAGACLVGVDPETHIIAALCASPSDAREAAEAMTETLAAHRAEAASLICGIAPLNPTLESR